MPPIPIYAEFIKELDETLTLSDSVSITVTHLVVNLSETDAVSLSDTLSIEADITLGVSNTETITLSDSVSIEADIFTGISQTDTITLTDSISIALDVGIENITVTETSTLTDSVSISAIISGSISQTDLVFISDSVSISKIAVLTLTETLNLTDTHSIYKPVSHGIAQTEAISLADTVSAALGVVAGALLKFNPFTGTLQWLKDLTLIDSHLHPDTDNSYDLGTSSLRFRNVYLNLPTSDPTVAGQLWNDSGTVKVSAG